MSLKVVIDQKIKQKTTIYKEYQALYESEKQQGLSICADHDRNIFKSYYLPENYSSKNRYTNIPCLESTRVKLSSANDYIHANYVKLKSGTYIVMCFCG